MRNHLKEFYKIIEGIRNDFPVIFSFFSKPQHWFSPVNVNDEFFLSLDLPSYLTQLIVHSELLPNALKPLHFIYTSRKIRTLRLGGIIKNS